MMRSLWVFGVVVGVFISGISCVSASAPAPPAPYTPSSDPFYDIMQIMSLCMDAMTTTSEQFLNSSHLVVSSIDGFGDRIVFTEGLIMDVSKQIGWMADKIVTTEEICGNLTVECFCDRPQNALDHVDVDVDVDVDDVTVSPVQTRVSRSLPSVVVDAPVGVSAGRLGGGPFDAMILMMLDMLDLYNQMSRNITTTLDDEVDAISEMGDRIVDTECLIVQMATQIGVMADRIVVTEQGMANVSHTCCDAVPTGWVSRNDIMPGLGGSPLPDCHNQTRRQRQRVPRRTRSMASRVSRPMGVGNSDLGDIWVDMVKKIVDPLMQAMSEMMTTMADGVLKGTATIGFLADDIVSMERAINAMGMAIGREADCIVAIEKLGFEMMERFCSGAPSFAPKTLSSSEICPPIKPVHPVNVTDNAVDAWRVRFAASQIRVGAALEEAKAGLRGLAVPTSIHPARDFKKMVALFEQFTDMMKTMAEAVSDEMTQVMDSIEHFSSLIMDTVGLINEEAGQINVMSERIVRTAQILAEIDAECQ